MYIFQYMRSLVIWSKILLGVYCTYKHILMVAMVKISFAYVVFMWRVDNMGHTFFTPSVVEMWNFCSKDDHKVLHSVPAHSTA